MEQYPSDDNLFSLENKYKKLMEDNSENQINIFLIGVLERVSTNRQFIEGDSIEMQRELAQEHARKIKGVIHKYYTEEGLSAKKTRVEKRPKIQQLKQDILDGKVNYVIVYKRDRMFRNNIEHMQFLQFLADNNCGIYCSARGEMQIDLAQFKVAGASKMLETMLSMMAEMESAQTAARVSDTMLSKAGKGEYTGGGIPIGYYRDENGIFRPMQATKEIVKTIEELYLMGYGYSSIAKWLNGGDVKGLPTLIDPVKKPIDDTKSQVWNHRNIMKILFSPFYTGHTSYESKKNPEINRIIKKVGFIEPIRTVERQRDLNELLHKKKKNVATPKKYNTPFLLSGLISCAECGEKLNVSTTQPKKSEKKHSYYRCKSHALRYKIDKCGNKGYRKEILEAEILNKAKETVSNLLTDDIFELLQKKMVIDKKSYVNKAKEIEKKINEKEQEWKGYGRIIAKLEMEEDFVKQKLYIGLQTEALNELNDLKETHSLLLEKGEGDSDTFDMEKFIELAKNFGNIIDESPIGIQKQLLETMFSNIRINKNGEVSMKINTNIAEAITPSVEDADLDDSTEVIFYGNGGSPMVTKDISSTESKFTISFSYYKYLEEVSEFFFKNLKPYVFSCMPEVNPLNAHKVNLNELKNVNIEHYIDDTLKRQHIARIYFAEKGNFNESVQRAFFNSSSMKLETAKKILEFANRDIIEYLNYLKGINSEFVIDDLDVLSTILYTYSNKTITPPEEKFQHVIFKDLIYCACGHKSYRKINRTCPVTYECKTRKNKYKLEKCKYKSTQEEILISTIFEQTGVKITNRSEASKIIEKIVYRSKNDFDIYYKQ